MITGIIVLVGARRSSVQAAGTNLIVDTTTSKPTAPRDGGPAAAKTVAVKRFIDMPVIGN